MRDRDLVLEHKSRHRPYVHNVFVSSGAVHSFVLYSLLSSCFKMASEKAKWSDYPHSYISGTQGVNTTPCCVVNTPALHGSREPSADTAPKIEPHYKQSLSIAPAFVPWFFRFDLLLRPTIKTLLTYSHENGYAAPFSSHATRKRGKRINIP